MRLSRAALAAAVWMAAAACSGHSPGAASTHPAGTPRLPAVPAASPATPGCSSATAKAPELTSVPTAMTRVPGSPFGVAVTPDGRFDFVALGGGGGIGVFRNAAAGRPSLIRTVHLASPVFGEVLTRDGRYLLVADGRSGAAVLSVSRAEQGRAGAVLGTLSAGRGAGAIEAAVSADGRLAFVTIESSAELAVFNLRQALTRGFGPADLVGRIRVGEAPVGMAVSPDGRWLYATTEGGLSPAAADPACPVFGSARGLLWVISMRRAQSEPARSVVARVWAGDNPVRVITSADGSVVWVTARQSDALLAFSAARLRSDPARSLIAAVRVGELPVGLALVDGGREVVVADSNRFRVGGAASSLAVVGVDAALAGRPAVAGYVRAGGFPREMELEPGGMTLLVCNYTSGQLEAVGVARLP